MINFVRHRRLDRLPKLGVLPGVDLGTVNLNRYISIA